MARKKKNYSKSSSMKCNFCMKSFSNLGCHFYHNPLCAEYHLHNDSTLVATNQQIQNLNDVSKNLINTETIEMI